jgi:predicted RNase H-like HicB family nuclease
MKKQKTKNQVNIFFSEEDGGYIADIPDLEHCSAFGNTPEEALNEVLRTKDTWLETARTAGKPVPAPCYRPEKHSRSPLDVPGIDVSISAGDIVEIIREGRERQANP